MHFGISFIKQAPPHMCALQHKSLQPQPISKNQERWQKQHTAAKAELGMCNRCACSPPRFDSHPATSTASPRSPRKLQTKNLQRTSSAAHVRKTLSAAASFAGRNKNARQGKAKSSFRPSVPVRRFVRSSVRSFVGSSVTSRGDGLDDTVWKKPHKQY